MKRLFPIASILAALAVYAYLTMTSAGRGPASVALVLTTLALAWVVYVVVRAAQALVKEPEKEEIARATGRRKKELEREKQSLLKALKELEFDHEMGKISDADYQEIGGNYRARAMRVMRQLDAAGGDVDYRSLVERDVKARSSAKPADDKPAEKGAAEKAADKPASADKPAEARSKPRCAGCSTENDLDAEFCKKCGKKLEVAA